MIVRRGALDLPWDIDARQEPVPGVRIIYIDQADTGDDDIEGTVDDVLNNINVDNAADKEVLIEIMLTKTSTCLRAPVARRDSSRRQTKTPGKPLLFHCEGGFT